jgi:hypothetical protein
MKAKFGCILCGIFMFGCVALAQAPQQQPGAWWNATAPGAFPFRSNAKKLPLISVKGNKFVDPEGKGISWLVWCFDPEWGPTLIKDWQYNLTPSGEYAKERMLSSRK